MSVPYFADDSVTLYHGDCIDVMQGMPASSVDAVVTDPPYGIRFMGKSWDGADIEDRAALRRSQAAMPDDGKAGANGGYRSTSTEAGKYDRSISAAAAFQEWTEEWCREAFRLLKPGGHALIFGGTRTWHRLAVAVEDAGFEIRDSIAWLYGQGFPKSMNVSGDARFCKCADSEAEYDLHHVSGGDVPAAEGSTGGTRPVLLAGMQEQGAPIAGRSELPSAEIRSRESGMERRRDVSPGEGELSRSEVCAVSAGTDGDGAIGRIRDGAPPSNGSVDRSAADTGRIGASHQSPTEGQPAVKFGTVADERGSQARRGWPVCSGCGKPSVPSGLGTALKPAFEPVVVGRKPLAGTVAANVTQYGTGALNIDGCRIGTTKNVPASPRKQQDRIYGRYGAQDGSESGHDPNVGRWPANVVLDESQAEKLDEQSGNAGGGFGRAGGKVDHAAFGGGMKNRGNEFGYGDSGGASRFFYVAKASVSERPKDGTVGHPTVKPLSLMRWLVRLVTPAGGVVLEPFAGSGTTIEACIIEGFRCVAIEREEAYVRLIKSRLNKSIQPVLDFGGVA